MGRTPPDTSPVTAVTFSEAGSSLCAASNGSLRVWDWDPAISSKVSLPTGWDNVHEMRVAANTNQLIAGSFISNFVSIYSIDLDELLGTVRRDGELSDDEGGEDSVVDESQPVHLDNTPEKLPDSLAKEVPDEDESPNDKWGNDDYENDFEDDFKLDKLDLAGGEEKDSKGSSGPGVEWEPGTTPRDLAASMGESFLAKLKENERKARYQDQEGHESAERTRPPSTAQRHRHRQPPQRPTTTTTTTDRSPAPKMEHRRPGTNSNSGSSSSSSGAVRKPISHYNGVDGAGNGQGGLDFEGLQIVGSKHAVQICFGVTRCRQSGRE